MIALVIVGALVASFLNAWSAVLQRRVAGKPDPKKLFGRDFITRLARNKFWLFGMGLQIAAFLVQALALKEGPLTVVEPLMTTDLVFLMLLLRWQFSVKPGLREWSAVAMLALGLSGLLVAANPHGGTLETSPIGWGITSAAIAAFILVSVYIVRRARSGKFRAALAGTAAGFNFALTAAFTKLTVRGFDHGVAHVFASWPIYALAVSGSISIIMAQSAYGAGPLAASQPAIEISDPVISIIFGVMLFGDTLNHSFLAILVEIISTTVLAIGIILMTGSRRIYESHA